MEKGTFKKKLFGKRVKEQREKLGLTQEELAYDLGLSKNFLSDKEARENMRLTQFELAEKIGVSPNFLGDIERGIKLPSLNKLIIISNILKLSLDSMFADSLDNILSEPEQIYYTDRQLAIMRTVIKTINDNF